MWRAVPEFVRNNEVDVLDIEVIRPGVVRLKGVFVVERLWWTVKHEWVYLRPAANGIEQKRSLGEFFDWYRSRMPSPGG